MSTDTNGAPTSLDALAECRRDIDRIDAVLIALLGERTRLAIHAGRIKRACGTEIAAPAREAAVIDRVRDLARGPLPGAAAARIFERIIQETRTVEDDAAARCL